MTPSLLAPIVVLAFLLGGGAIAQQPGNAPKPPPTAADPAARDAALRKEIASVEDPARLLPLARGFAARGDHAAALAAWERLVELRPHLGDYRLQLAVAHARLARRSQAYTTLLDLQGSGYAYDLRGDQRFEKVADTEVWEHILRGFEANRQPFGEGKAAFTLPADDLLVESLAWDPARKTLLAGSARKGAVYRVDRKGRLKPLVKADDENGMWAVMDIAVDAGRDLLWVASTAIPHFEDYDPEQDLGRAGVFKFELSSGKFLDRYLSPVVLGQSFFISGLAVGSKGEVYAADGVNNAVYVVRGDEFKRLFHAPRLTGIRGMAVDGEGGTLYFADNELGIFGFDLATARPFDLRVPPKLALAGIEGLVWWDGALLAVQGHMQPRRIMRLELSEDGRSVSAAAPVEANKAELSAPTAATLGDGRLYLVANSQKGNYDRFGLLRDRGKLEGTLVWSVDPGYNRPAAAPGD